MEPRLTAPILIVDDEPANLLALEAVLDALGEPIVRADSGAAALRELRDQDFAAVLLDVRMPIMDGFETARLVRAQRRSRATPIIFITADASDLSVESAYAMGAVDFLTKPLQPAVLKAKLAFFIELHRSKQELVAAERQAIEDRAFSQAAREAAAAEQVRREEAETAAALVRESQERVTLATDAARLGIWVWDIDGDRLGWENERLYSLFGVVPGEHPQSAQAFIDEFVHPDDQEAFEQAIAFTASIGTRLHFEGRFVRRGDGALRWIELTGVLQAAGHSPRRILGTAADITERKHAEEELRRSEERYRTLFESIDEGFCVIDMMFDDAGKPVDYRFLEMNPAFAKQTGLVRALGKRAREMVPDLSAFWFETYGRVALTGEAVRFDNEARAMNRWFDVYAARLGGPESRKVAILFNDITERRRDEENLRRLAAELAETDRRKTEFLATLAHELRNPLAPISNGLQLLRMSQNNPEAHRKARDMMERQLKHMVHLVDDLLDIARISSNKVELRRERLDLEAIMTSAVETSMPLVTAGGHELGIRMPEQAMQVVGDPTRLGQVISNLLNNAAKYTPQGGRIVLEATRDGDHAVVTVSDNGVGIAPDALENVFGMFTQVGGHRDRSQGGLGIGLALVTRLVELHGGTVKAESAGTGMGSTFTVRLPLAQARDETAQPAPREQEPAPPAPPLRILVVDDNADAADSLASLLEFEGHATRVAHDADAALGAANEFRPDIVFLDIGMPGKDGYQVARELRDTAATRDAVLVALTGWGAAEDRMRTRNAGFDHHLTKPAGLDAVEALLGSIAAANGSQRVAHPAADR